MKKPTSFISGRRSRILVLAACFFITPAFAAPPFINTAFLDPDIITESDPTTFTGLVDAGQGIRVMFDRRVNAFVQYNAYLFNASYSDGLAIEIQVNPEFGSVTAARAQAAYYAPVIGRIPRALRADVQTVWLHQGDQPFGGGNNNLLIHTGLFAQDYIASGVLEEIFVHEACHTSLDAAHANSAGWIAAQNADAEFISDYALANPFQEDIAESFVPWLAQRFRSSRLDLGVAAIISNTIPNRLAYFDSLNLNIAPVTNDSAIFADGFD